MLPNSIRESKTSKSTLTDFDNILIIEDDENNKELVSDLPDFGLYKLQSL